MLAEHFNPLLEHISKLEEALYNIQFEQHWLEAQTDRQAIGTVQKNWVFDIFLYHLNDCDLPIDAGITKTGIASVQSTNDFRIYSHNIENSIALSCKSFIWPCDFPSP